MNKKQLVQLGVPADCANLAITAIRSARQAGLYKGSQLKEQIKKIAANPIAFQSDEHFAQFAQQLQIEQERPPLEPITYRTWGREIDKQTHDQMLNACHVPMATGAALMPDAHVGYGLPIGGVLALENAVIPYAVGVDIACRMKLSVLDSPADSLSEHFHSFQNSLEKGTRFGVGCEYKNPQQHAVMDQDWTITRITRQKKDKAWKQLGTSGSGNHFVEFGLLTIDEQHDDFDLPPGTYVALLSHSGSRGSGAAVCSTYSNIARTLLPKRYAELAYLSWLSLDREAGQEYWAAMNLMGDYAAANHDVIHKQVTSLMGAEIIAGVENHHNFAWKEAHNGKEVIVHRKGATPAGEGMLGVIPGSMASPAYVVRGKGNAESLHSASHGAGRCMSRKKAKDTFNLQEIRKDLTAQGVHLISAGADEVPGVYKDIEQVMSAQQDLVDVVARFDPKIVKMCGDGSRAED